MHGRPRSSPRSISVYEHVEGELVQRPWSRSIIAWLRGNFAGRSSMPPVGLHNSHGIPGSRHSHAPGARCASRRSRGHALYHDDQWFTSIASKSDRTLKKSWRDLAEKDLIGRSEAHARTGRGGKDAKQNESQQSPAHSRSIVTPHLSAASIGLTAVLAS
jgi:hypothetical protein